MQSKEVTQKVNEITRTVNKELADYYNRLDKIVSIAKAKAQSVTDTSREVKPCGIAQQVEDLSEEDRQVALSTVKGIETDVIKDKEEYGYVDIYGREYTGGSTDSGEEGRKVELVNVGIPKWVQEIQKSISSKLKRVTKREWFDVEGLHRGVTRKKKERGMKKTDYLYFLLDVSGSMSYYSYKGVPLLALLASYVPSVAKKYDGLWMQVDGGQIVPKELSKIGKGEIKSLILAGGGGAQFESAIAWMKEHIAKHNIQNPIVIMASDGDENFDFELLPNTIFVTTPDGVKAMEHNGMTKQGFPNPLKGQKVIEINIDAK
jgi:hypothetical protein